MRYYLEVHAAHQASERFELSHRLAFVTRGGLRVVLPARDCPSELHLLEVEGTPAGAQVTIPQGAPGAFTLEGQTQRSAVVPWAGEVFWEGLRLALVQVAKPKERSSVVLLGLVGILLCGGFAAAGGATHPSTSREPEPPKLTLAPTTCPAGDAEAAQRQARLAERTGLARREQSGFIAADARAALTAFAEAEACYRLAGQSERAAFAAELGRDWSLHLNADYTASRLRLQRALVQKRDAEALLAIADIERMLARQSGPYLDWLASLRAELERRTRSAQR